MKRRAIIYSAVALALVVGVIAIRLRGQLPDESSAATFAQDLRAAKRIFGSDYAGYLAAIRRYGDQAFFDNNSTAVEEELRTQGALNLQRPFESDLRFELDGVEPTLPDGIQAIPSFGLHTDPFSGGQNLEFSVDCALTLNESSQRVRQAMIQAGGFLGEIAKRPGFTELVRNYPVALSGTLSYSETNRFDLQMKFMAPDFRAMSIRYAAHVLVEPEEVRYVSWLPITYKRAKGTVAKIDTEGEDSGVQWAYAAKDVVRSLHRVDLKYPYPTGIRLHYTSTENELETLPVETQGIQFVPPITKGALEKLARFNQLKSLSYIDPIQGGTPLLGLDKLVSLEFLSVEGELSVATVDAICRLPRLSDLHLEAANLSEGALAKIAAIPNLNSLYFSSSRVGDVGLEALAGNKSLEQLTIGERVGFTNRGVQALGRMNSLRALHFYVPRKVNLQPIYRRKNLEVLGLSRFKPTENDISSLASMSHLQGLMLDEISGVTPDQLLSFSKLINLREFYFNQPNFPAAYMRQLRSLLPGKWLRN